MGVSATAACLICIPACLEVTFCKCHLLRGGVGARGEVARNEESGVSSDSAVAVDTEIMRHIGHWGGVKPSALERNGLTTV